MNQSTDNTVEFWREMAESFWYGWYHGDSDIMEAVGERATPYFEEDEDDEEDV